MSRIRIFIRTSSLSHTFYHTATSNHRWNLQFESHKCVSNNYDNIHMCVCCLLEVFILQHCFKSEFLKSSKNSSTHFAPKNGLSKRKFHVWYYNMILCFLHLKYVIHNTGTTQMHRPFDSTLISCTSQYLYLGFTKKLKLCWGRGLGVHGEAHRFSIFSGRL